MSRAAEGRPEFIDHSGTAWWIAELLTTLLIAWSLVTVLLRDPPAWAWAILITCFACWTAFVGLVWWFPRLATGSLALCSVLSSASFAWTGDTVLVVACVALGIFASHPEQRVRWIIAITGIDMALAGTLTPLAGSSLIAAVGAVVAMLVMVLIGLNRRQYQVQAHQTKQLLEQTRRAQHQQARAAALDERARIAREMHDVLAHSLGALGMQLEVAEALLADKGDTAGALDRIRRARRLAGTGLTEARNAVAALRRDVPALPDAITELAEEHQRDQDTGVSVRIVGDTRPISSATTVSLLDTARESLTNAAKHAPGRPVGITLAYNTPGYGTPEHDTLDDRAPDDRAPDDTAPDDTAPDEGALDHDGAWVRLSVSNASPAEPVPAGAPESGFGLTGMRERITLAGGTLSAGPDGHGWSVVAEVPAEGDPAANGQAAAKGQAAPDEGNP